MTSNRDQRFCKLERMVLDLRQENERLRRSCSRLKSENKKLRKGSATAAAHARRSRELELKAASRAHRDCLRRLAKAMPHAVPVLSGGWRGGFPAMTIPATDFGELLPGLAVPDSRTSERELSPGAGRG